MAASCSSSSGGSFKYDVFINFRGEDTRRSFVCHLYDALKQTAVDTFIDSDKLQKGDDLSELFKAIQDSRLSIVVFSKNYASSTWCLKELVHILKCMNRQSQIVVPIFYEVDPSHVRKLKKSFAEAFAEHDSNSNLDKEELERWKSSLTRATDLSGYDSRNYQDDSKLIKSIVEDILEKLIRISRNSKTDGLIGMDIHMDKIDSLFKLGVDDCRIVGIWGMGGIGKSTIARAVYDKISPQFEHKCFLDNVKEGFLTKNDAVQMVEDLLCSILNLKDRRTSVGGLNMMRERLGKRKVLIVLDDVDALDQIETLIGENPSFGCGSRIIITTRNRKSLAGFSVYEPKLFAADEALELFRRHAFRTIKFSESYDEISRRAVKYAHRLPLALKVLGALLDNNTVQEWEYELNKIKKIPITFLDNKIGRVLWASFDGLDEWQKNIFLDIACFFRGRKKEDVTQFHESCGFFPQNGLRVLEERSLVTVSYGLIEMHDLIQEMGRDIVYRESTKDPGRRSRLWYYDDVLQVLAQNTPAEAVEGLILKLSELKELCVNAEAFVSMKRLRMLQIAGHTFRVTCKQHVSGELKFLSNELRILNWDGCPLKSLPSDFQPKNLTEINMPYSHIEQLWEGTKPLPNLVYMDLRYSRDLIRTPDLTKATNLKTLNLEGCTSLLEVHPSISALKSLVRLNLQGCSNLEKFPNISGNMKELSRLNLNRTVVTEMPSSINDLPALQDLSLSDCRELRSLPSSIHIKSLEQLNLSGCSKLEEFPEISQVMEKLSWLYVDGTAIKQLSSSIDNLTILSVLTMRNCTSLVSLPDEICNLALRNLVLTGCSKLEKLPDNFQNLKSLGWKGSLDNLKGSGIKQLPLNLTEINMPYSHIELLWEPLNLTEINMPYSHIEQLWEGTTPLPNLVYMDLRYSRDLIRTPDLTEATNLEILNLKGCTSLLEVHPSISAVKSLRMLNLRGCSNLGKFPNISGTMKRLAILYLDETAVTEIPSSINDLPGLQELSLRNCRELSSLPSSIHMKSLEYLDLSGCSKFEEFPEISQVMEKLFLLDLAGTAIRELPSSINNVTGLEYVCMRKCTSLVSLPDEIFNLARLEHLNLCGCSKLEKLPDNFQKIIMGMRRLSCKRCKVLTAPFSSSPKDSSTVSFLGPMKFIGIGRSPVPLVHLDLSDCNLLDLSDAIAHLSSLKRLKLCRNKHLESLPAAMNRLPHLSELHLQGCESLKSIPELPSSIQQIEADNCTSLETVSTPKHPCVGNIRFTFFNCFKLVKTNLFMDIVEAAAADNQGYQSNYSDFCYRVSLPGSDISNWFSHQCRGSFITVQLGPDWSQRLAICAISNLRGAYNRTILKHVFCCASFKENDVQDNINFQLFPIDNDGGSDMHIELDHMFLGYLNSSNLREWHNDRKYTEATFRIVTSSCPIRNFLGNPNDLMTCEDCSWITSCGVRLFQNALSSVDLVCSVENRGTEISSKRKRNTRAG